jgi:hypothetical protein
MEEKAEVIGYAMLGFNDRRMISCTENQIEFVSQGVKGCPIMYAAKRLGLEGKMDFNHLTDFY